MTFQESKGRVSHRQMGERVPNLIDKYTPKNTKAMFREGGRFP